jgi:flagellar secretion chaperone FliS
MRTNHKAIAAYGDVKVTTGVASADGVQLIQMLFDGLLESLAATKGHIQNGAIVEKGKSIARASRIVIGLQGALDFERGGDLASNLNELYGYVTRRLLHVNARNDLDALEEIFGLMNEIRSAWEGVPDLIPASPRAGALLN